MRVLFISLAIVLFDQITKLLVKGFSIPFLNIRYTGMLYGEKHNIIGDLLRFTYIENPGMAFGIDLGVSSKLLLSLFSVAASIAIIIYLFKIKNESLPLRISLAVILGGAAGNLIDRVFYGVFYGYAPLFYGKVVDFIDVDFFKMRLFGYTFDRWPVFNVADMAVSIGVILLLIFSGNAKQPEHSVDTSAESQSNISEPLDNGKSDQ